MPTTRSQFDKAIDTSLLRVLYGIRVRCVIDNENDECHISEETIKLTVIDYYQSFKVVAPDTLKTHEERVKWKIRKDLCIPRKNINAVRDISMLGVSTYDHIDYVNFVFERDFQQERENLRQFVEDKIMNNLNRINRLSVKWKESRDKNFIPGKTTGF